MASYLISDAPYASWLSEVLATLEEHKISQLAIAAPLPTGEVFTGYFGMDTYITYLRQKDENYIVDYYPLGIAEISDYLSNGQPVVLINMSKLKSALSKSMLKDKKNKALFFENQETEIQNNYPDEVYQAFKNGDTYVKIGC